MVGLQSVTEVKREESGPEGRPQEAEEQEDALVAPSFVSVQVEEPQLYVDHQKEPSIQNCVEDREAQLDRGSYSWLQGDWRGQGGENGKWDFDWSFHCGAGGPD